MKLLKAILWCGLGLLVIQLIATVSHEVDPKGTPALLATIAYKGPRALWISHGLLVLVVLVFIFLISRKFEYQRRHFALTTTAGSSFFNWFRWLLTGETYVHVSKPAVLLAKYAELAKYVYHREEQSGRGRSSPPGEWRPLHIGILDEALQQRRNLYAEALIDDTAREIAIVFRGTDERSDICSYLGGLASDQYTAAMELGERLAGVMEEDHRNRYTVVAVGHSLGGGLAQCFAYHARQNEQPVVKRVYAFNTTPIVGVPKAKREGVEVTLAFERGEILEYLRLVYDRSWSAFSDVKVYRFNFSTSRDPLLSHEMSELWKNLAAATDLQIPGPASVEDQRQQRELIYDYIKFHIGLYLATPPIIVLLAEGLAVPPKDPNFLSGFIVMLLLYILAGTHAGWFMGATINMRWESDNLEEFNDRAFDPIRRFVHHWLYWAGVAVGLSGIFFAKISN